MEKLEKYKFINKISNGAFGEVFLYENNCLNQRKEAVKIIKITNIEDKERIDEINRNLFESSVLEYLKKCRYIVEVYDAEVLDDCFRINMEFLEEGSLGKRLIENSFLDIKQIIKISECVLHALEYAHNRGILHLDIKPGNILIEDENIFKLSDFGLANLKDENGVSSFKGIYGSHCPPEKLSGVQQSATEQTDVYMFGVTLYRLLNGDSYLKKQLDRFTNKDEFVNAVILGKFPDRKNYLPHVNKKIKRIVNKCLNVNLEKRYKNVREIRKDISKIKVKYFWINKEILENKQYWQCLFKNKLFLELLCEKNSKNLWTILLQKTNNKNKERVTKHCFKNLNTKTFYKKIGYIFNEYF